MVIPRRACLLLAALCLCAATAAAAAGKRGNGTENEKKEVLSRARRACPCARLSFPTCLCQSIASQPSCRCSSQFSPPSCGCANQAALSVCSPSCQSSCLSTCPPTMTVAICQATCSATCQSSCQFNGAIKVILPPQASPSNCGPVCSRACMRSCSSVGRPSVCLEQCRQRCEPQCVDTAQLSTVQMTTTQRPIQSACTPACQPTCDPHCVATYAQIDITIQSSMMAAPAPTQNVYPVQQQQQPQHQCPIPQCAPACESACVQAYIQPLPTAQPVQQQQQQCSVPQCAPSCDPACIVQFVVVPDPPTTTTPAPPQCIPQCQPTCDPACIQIQLQIAQQPVPTTAPAPQCPVVQCAPACEPGCIQAYTQPQPTAQPVQQQQQQCVPQCQPACDPTCISIYIQTTLVSTAPTQTGLPTYLQVSQAPSPSPSTPSCIPQCAPMCDSICIAAYQKMMQTQQEELKALREQSAQRGNTASASDTPRAKGPTVDSLEKQIRVFTYNPGEGLTFDAWWTRHEDVFETVNMDDEEKGRMMMRHVEDTVDRQFRDHIRPKKLGEMSFTEVKVVMAKLFGDKKTLFEKRLDMFNLKMSKVHIDDLREFATRVNRVVEDANVTQLTPDKIKTMIFLAGVDLPRHTGAMFQIINGMKKEENPTLEKILEIADSFKEAQLDSQTVTGQNRSQVNAVKKHHGGGKEKSRRDSTSEDSGDNECGRCSRDHEEGRCPFVNAICHKCGETGHIRVKCPGKNKGTRPKFNKIKSESSGNSGEFDVSMDVNGKAVEMSVDSGSDLTYISEHTWNLVGSPRARCTDVTPVCTNGSIFRVKGKCDVNLEMNGIHTSGEVYITEDTNVLGRDHMPLFFTLMPKGQTTLLKHSINGIEVTEKEETTRSGTGMVDEHPRNHSIRGIEVTVMEDELCSGIGQMSDQHDRLRSGSASLTRSSLRDDSIHSKEETIMVEQSTAESCALEEDWKTSTSESERGSSLKYGLKQRVMTGSHSGLRGTSQMEAGEDPPEKEIHASRRIDYRNPPTLDERR